MDNTIIPKLGVLLFTVIFIFGLTDLVGYLDFAPPYIYILSIWGVALGLLVFQKQN